MTSVDDGTPQPTLAYPSTRTSAGGGGPTVFLPATGNGAVSNDERRDENGADGTESSAAGGTPPTSPMPAPNARPVAPTGVASVPSVGVAAVPPTGGTAGRVPRTEAAGSMADGPAPSATAGARGTAVAAPAGQPAVRARGSAAVPGATTTRDPVPSNTTSPSTPSSTVAATIVAPRPATVVGPKATTTAQPPDRRRLTGLDGMRGLAALFVVIHHSYLAAYPGYPAITGPWWASWFIYGHFSVVVFIVLSGFSLSVSAARHGWKLGGKAKFAKRRAWRILPPYWAALIFSLAIAWTVIPQPGEGSPTAKSVVINGLLVQDIFGAPTPNGAFWSIAVEAQLYIVFPLMLLLLRRGSAAVMLSVVGCVVALVGIFAPSMPLVEKLMRFTPQFAVLFALGVVAAGILASSPSTQRLPWQWFAGFAAVPVFALIEFRGSIWTVAHFFWVDMLIGIPVALLLAAVATGHPAWLLKVLDLRPIRRLGSFSYSLYLIHAPILVVVSTKFVAPHLGTGSAAFLATAGIAGTLSVAFAWLFATVFEIPFQRHRSWAALRGAARARILRMRAVTDPSKARLVAAAANGGPASEPVTESPPRL